MADRVVLVNGLPASGKTTLGAELAVRLDWIFLSKDVVVDALAAQVWPRIESGRLGGIALDTVYALGGAITGGPRVIEVWCEVSQTIAHERFEARRPSRHPLHGAWRPGFWDHAVPMTEHPIRVDTATAVDMPSLVRSIRAAVGD